MHGYLLSNARTTSPMLRACNGRRQRGSGEPTTWVVLAETQVPAKVAHRPPTSPRNSENRAETGSPAYTAGHGDIMQLQVSSQIAAHVRAV